MLFHLIRREKLVRDGKLWRFEGTRVICKGFQENKLALKRESYLEWRLRFEGLIIISFTAMYPPYDGWVV